MHLLRVVVVLISYPFHHSEQDTYTTYIDTLSRFGTSLTTQVSYGTTVVKQISDNEGLGSRRIVLVVLEWRRGSCS